MMNLSNQENKYKNDPKYEKYFKMLKMGVPIDAIKHKMICDNLDPDIIDSNSSNTNTNVNQNVSKSSAPPPAPPLPFQLSKSKHFFGNKKS